MNDHRKDDQPSGAVEAALIAVLIVDAAVLVDVKGGAQ
jgi:hypothetical protein